MSISHMKLGQAIELDVYNKFTRAHRKYRGITQNLEFRNYWNVEHYRQGLLIAQYRVPNDITNEGKNLILDVMFHDATQIPSTSWYTTIVNAAGFSAFAAADTMASHGGWTEWTSYTQATRVAWGPGAAASQQISNATPMTFDINASGTVHGIAVTSNNTKGGTTGKLWATGPFTADVPVSNGDQLKITYTVAT